MNQLYFGDNLDVLREHIADETVDLVYLDPPFNSNATYNLLFRSASGRQSDAQIEAFDDTWQWGPAASAAFHEVIRQSDEVAGLLSALRSFLGTSDMMAYLAMMTVRLVELRRVMKPTASLYLHCDPTASHYLKIILDGVFGAKNFRNDIIWVRSKNPKGSQHKSIRFGPATDSLLFYSKSDLSPLYIDRVRRPLAADEIIEKYDREDENGRWADGPILRSSSMGPRPNLVYEYKGFMPGMSGWRMNKENLEELDLAGDLYWTEKGQPRRKFRPRHDRGEVVSSFWGDIAPVNSQAQERIGYPTQKPLALLERIIAASSNPGDVVLDPFCGCGTAIHAAQRLERAWIGIDVTHLAIEVIEERLAKHLPAAEYIVRGRPVDFESAVALAHRDKHQFQLWAIWLVKGKAYQDGKKGKDRGIDGQKLFTTGDGNTHRAIISVKGGENLGPGMVRDLRGTVEREAAACGLLILLRPPTREMMREAAAAGMTDTAGRPVPRLQIRTIADLLMGIDFDLPGWAEPMVPVPIAVREHRAAKRRKRPDPRQKELLLTTPGGRALSSTDENAQPVSLPAAGTPMRRSR